MSDDQVVLEVVRRSAAIKRVSDVADKIAHAGISLAEARDVLRDCPGFEPASSTLDGAFRMVQQALAQALIAVRRMPDPGSVKPARRNSQPAPKKKRR